MISTVVCEAKGCAYRSDSGFCNRRFLIINPNGTCGWCYSKEGKINERWNFPLEKQKMEKTGAEVESYENIKGKSGNETNN